MLLIRNALWLFPLDRQKGYAIAESGLDKGDRWLRTHQRIPLRTHESNAIRSRESIPT